VPVLDLERERNVQEACLLAAEAGLLRSAHDCSDGGLAVALTECCFSSLNREGVGADIQLRNADFGLRIEKHTFLNPQSAFRIPQDTDSRLLFSESPSRIIISFDEAMLGSIEEIAARANCPFTILGRTGSDRLSIKADGEEVINLSVAELEAAWRSSLATKLRAEVVTAV